MNDSSIFSKKMSKELNRVASQFMLGAEGIYSQESVIEIVRFAASHYDPAALVEAACKEIARKAISAHTKPHLSHNDDWIGYGNMGIALPEAKIVNVRYASINALEVRKANVIENRDNVVKASKEEIDRIETVQNLMLKLDVDIAEPALRILAMEAKRKAA